jgi:acetyl-CoA carboxylase biotin carboxyl carrier protein
MTMVPGKRLRTNRPAVGNRRPGGRHAVYIVARNTSRGRRVAQVEAHITGTVWKIEVAVGDQIQEGDAVVILESMKMEMPVEAEDPGTVAEILVEEGQSVSEGDVLVVLS